MSAIGSLTKFVPAQAVTVERGSQELTLVNDVKIIRSHVTTRTNTRAGPIDTFAWRVQELEFLVLLTDDLKTQIEADNTLNASSVFANKPTYTITGVSQNAGANNVIDVLEAVLVDYDSLAPESGAYNARMKLRVTGSAT